MNRDLKLSKPGFRMAVLLVMMVVGIQLALAIPLGIADVVLQQVFHRPSPHLEQQPAVIACINLVAFGAAIWLGLRLNRLCFREVFPFRHLTPFQMIGVAVSVLGAGVLLSEADNALRSVLPLAQFWADVFKEVFFNRQSLVSRVFLLVVVAPLTEELLFRGVILRGLLSHHTPTVALLVSSFLFAAVHLNPWQFPSALSLGVILGWFYLRTGSVLACILGHAIANGLSIIVLGLPWDIPGMTGGPTGTVVAFQPLWLDISGLLVLVAGVRIFSKATPSAPHEAVPPVIEPVREVDGA
jgi:membrane protease YdiL (CAAX protease family)